MQSKDKKTQHGILCIKLVSLQVCMVFALIALIPVSGRAAGFSIIKGDSGYEPEMYDEPGVILPRVNMKAGTFRFLLDEATETAKAGVLVPHDALYYVGLENYTGKSPAEERLDGDGVFDPGGDCIYGVHKDYFTLDCWSYGSVSGHSRKMFLFRFSTEAVKLLDVITAADGLDFRSAYSGDLNTPAWTEVNDYDGDGNVELILKMESGSRRDPLYEFHLFDMYVELSDAGLHADFATDLYKPLFEQERHRKLSVDATAASYRIDRGLMVRPEETIYPLNSKGKSDAYYIYGFLSRELSLEDINRVLTQDGELYEGQNDYVARIIEAVNVLDKVFHDHGGYKPILIRYELGR